MATTKEYKEFVVQKLNVLENIICRPMMGEYLLYYDGILFGGIYDGRVLVKITESNKKYHMQEEVPYEGAKKMFMISDLEDEDMLKKIIIDTSKDLPNKKK